MIKPTWADSISDKAPGKLVRTTEGAMAFVPNPLPVGLALTDDIHRLIAEARARLGELKGIGSLCQNPALFVRGLQTREAAASSRIEGTRTTNEEALASQVAAVDIPNESDAREVDNYVKALRQGVGALAQGRRINVSLLNALHQTLLTGVRGQQSQPGKIREVQNYVAGSSDGIHEARFIPPPPLKVGECLDDLQRYIDTPSPDDPIVRAALVHYQFETIHPFEDGNGRIGRALIALQTIQEKLQDQPLLFISSGIEARKREYCDRLLAVSMQGDYPAWVAFFARAMIDAAEDTASRIHRMVATTRKFREKLRTCTTPHPANLLVKLEEYPFLTVKSAREFLGISGAATADAIAVLEKHKILDRAKFKIRREGRGRPPALYYCEEILNILA